jgi:hypothetical protein
MADNLRIGIEMDVSPMAQLSAASKQVGDAVESMAQKFLRSGLNAKEAASAMTNLGVTSREAALACGLLSTAETQVAASSVAATTAMSGFERAAAMAGGRVLGMEAGLGMAGGALGRMAAYLPGIGQLFAVALPVSLIIMAGEKLSEFNSEIAKGSREIAEMAIASGDWSSKIEIENLKLEDQIAKFEHRPSRNLLKEAILEAEVAADGLAKSLNEASQKIVDTMTSSSFGASAANLFNHMFNPDVAGAVGEAASKKALQPFEDAQQNIRLKLAVMPETDVAGRAALNEQLAQSYKDAAAAAEHQEEILEANKAKEVSTPAMYDATIAALKDYRIAMTEASKAAGGMKDNVDLKISLGGLDQAEAVRKFWEEWSGGFNRMQSEIVRSDAMWREFWVHQRAEYGEDGEQAKEASRLTAEGQRETAEQMAAVSKQLADTNLRNADEAMQHAQDNLKALQTGTSTFKTVLDTQRTQGQTQVSKSITDTQQTQVSKSVIDTQETEAFKLSTDTEAAQARLQASIGSITGELGKLQAEMDSVSKQTFLSESDQTNLDAYAKKIQDVQKFLDGLKGQSVDINLKDAEDGIKHIEASLKQMQAETAQAGVGHVGVFKIIIDDS